MMNEHERDPVREFLESAKEAKLEIARHRARVEELESRCTRVTPNMNASPGGGSSDSQQMWAMLADERMKVLAAEKAEVEKYHEVENFINRIGVPVQRAILRMRYLRCLRWIPIQMELYKQGHCYDERSIFRIHNQALDAARELWEQGGGGADEVPAESTPEVLH